MKIGVKFLSELMWRIFGGVKGFKNPTLLISLVGVSLGVACLMSAMAGFSGFETSLRDSVTNLTGHIMLFERGSRIEKPNKMAEEVLSLDSRVKAVTPFVMLDGAAVAQGKMNFVYLHGVDPETFEAVSNLDRYLVKGEFNFDKKDPSYVVIGVALANFLGVQVGDELVMVLPNPDRLDSSVLAPKSKKFVISGLVDLGKYDTNLKTMITNLSTAQKFGDFGSKATGLRLKIGDPYESKKVGEHLVNKLGSPFYIKEWQDLNQYLFSSIEVEKITIFFVLLILIVAAAFNVCTTMFISNLKKIADLSLLRSLGLRKVHMFFLTLYYSLIVALVGCLIGTAVGLVFIFGFEFLQSKFNILPSEVYKISHLRLEIRWLDMLWVYGATIGLCMLSSFVPALRSAKLSPIEGLKYE